jgi:TPP-dependent pyruvate/acetoin dehydrogenase alpha subunit
MAKAVAASSYENPLIPNARLRQIYLAMLRMRMLARALPAGRRAGLGHEACLVSTSVDLGRGDLVSDALTGGVVEFLRGASLGSVLQPGTGKSSRKHGTGVGADCGKAACLAVAPGVAERMWAAMGAPAALKIRSKAAVRTKYDPTHPDETGRDGASGVVVVYALSGEVPAALWRKVLGFAAEQALPVVFVILPTARGGKAGAPKLSGLSALALTCGVPGIAVDADDAVAIYRVAQESIGRARIGGGAALMECIPFTLAGSKIKPADAIAELERYMLRRGVCTQVWLDREAKSFAKRVVRVKSASR